MKGSLRASSGHWKRRLRGMLAVLLLLSLGGCEQPVHSSVGQPPHIRGATTSPVETERGTESHAKPPWSQRSGSLSTRSPDGNRTRFSAAGANGVPRLLIGCYLQQQNGESTCIMSSHTPHGLWVESKCAELELKESGRPARIPALDISNGCQLSLSCDDLPVRATVSVHMRGQQLAFSNINVDCSDRSFFQFVVRARSRVGVDQANLVAEITRRLGETNVTNRTLEAAYALALASSQRGDYERSNREWRQLESLALGLGHSSIAARALYQQAETLRRLGRVEDAKHMLLQLHSRFPEDLVGLWVNYLLGDIERDESKYASAQGHLLSALQTAERLGEMEHVRYIVPLIADCAESIGDNKRVAALLAKARELHLEASTCDMANFWQQLAFISLNLSSRISTGASTGLDIEGLSVRQIFDRALGYRSNCAAFDNNRLLANLYMGFVAFENLNTRPSDALQWAAKAKKLPMSPITELQLLDHLTQAYTQLRNQTDAMRVLLEFESKIGALPKDSAALFDCFAAQDRLEVANLAGRTPPNLSATLRACISDNDERLSSSEKLMIINRLKRIGIAH